MKNSLAFFVPIIILFACGKNNGTGNSPLSVYDPAKEVLTEAGINTNGLSGFFHLTSSNVSLENEDLLGHSVSCSDGTKSHIFILTREEKNGQPTSNYTVIKELIYNRPEAYTSVDIGYGEKEYKIFDLTAATQIKIRNGTLFCVLADLYHQSKTLPQDGEINMQTFYAPIQENIKVLIDSKENGSLFIEKSQEEDLIPTENGAFIGKAFYGLNGQKQYDVYEYTHWGKCDYYYDEHDNNYYPLSYDNSGSWLLAYSGTQLVGAQLGMYYNPIKTSFTEAYGPFVIKICVEDMKEGAYSWRSFNITSLEDNNRYESVSYAGRNGNVYKWIVSGTAYSGEKFTYTISADAQLHTLIVKDQNNQPVSIHNEFSSDYTKHR